MALCRQLLFAALSLFVAVGHASAQGWEALGACRLLDSRERVPVWKPELNDKGYLSSVPPTRDGQIVFIEISGDNETVGCSSASKDKLYSFSIPNDVNNIGAGGLAVNLRGNVQFANGYCIFSGFYMNQRVFGMHQGWIETYFGAVDKFELVKSGRFCVSE